MSGKTGGRWIPLESNPEVFNDWALKVGVATGVDEFVDVYGLDSELLALLPQPVKAIVLLFPTDPARYAANKEEDARIKRDGQPKLDPTIFWIKQTIGNACGTMGLIHALANSNVTYSPTSSLQKFIMEAKDKTPLERSKLLETTPHFANVHAETANKGQTAPHEETDLHFTCFVQAPEADIRAVAGEEAEGRVAKIKPEDHRTSGLRIVELDGDREGPIDHGECKNFVEDVAKIIQDRYMTGSSSFNFSVMALVPKAN